MKDYVLPLVSNVVVLEAEKSAEPVEKVHVGEPWRKGGFAEVADGA